MRPYKMILGCFAAALFSVAATGYAPAQDPVAVEEATVVKTETVEIPYKVEYQFDRSLGPGRMEKVRHGVNGFVKKTVQYVQRDGELVEPAPAPSGRVVAEPVGELGGRVAHRVADDLVRGLRLGCAAPVPPR